MADSAQSSIRPVDEYRGDYQVNQRKTGFSPYRSAIVNKAASILAKRKDSRSSWKWIMINTLFAAMFYVGILEKSLEQYGFHENIYAAHLDYFLSLLFLWNSLVNFYIYLSPSFKNDPIVVNPKQKKLLQIDDRDKSFIVKDSRSEDTTTPKTVRQIATWPKRRKSSTPNGSIFKDTTPERGVSPFTTIPAQDTSFSPNHQLLNRSFESTSSTPITIKQNTSANSLTVLQSSPGLSPGRHDDQINDPESLNRYLKNHEEKDSIIRRAKFDTNRNAGQSFWNYGRSALEFLPTFGTYQLATRSPQSPNHATDDLANSFDYDVILKVLNVRRADIDNWTENLRKWIAETIVEKLVAEIKTINDVLIQNGCSEHIIGSVGLSILRNVAVSKSQLVPTLHSVIPYLDVCANQEYLVKRLEDLATGGCLRLYKWDSGGTYKGKKWDQELPTDAHIVSHLFCSYMDTHLPSNPRYQNSFTGLHFLKPPNKPSDSKCDICILQTRTQPPHFKVVDSDETLDTPPGRHNLFVAISIFLYLIKTKKHGMLERVNLGASGLNILWILNKR